MDEPESSAPETERDVHADPSGFQSPDEAPTAEHDWSDPMYAGLDACPDCGDPIPEEHRHE